MTHPPPENGPFATREQAANVFAAFARAAELGRSGPPGEEVTFTRLQLVTETLTDTIERWTELGQYDHQVIGLLAGLLDPVEAAVVGSWFYRVMRDVPDNPTDQEGHR